MLNSFLKSQVRLRLVHALLRSDGMNLEFAASAFVDASSYISHLAHVSRSCCLSFEEEMELWESLLKIQSDMESANRFIQWRRSLLTARKQGLEKVALQWQRRDPGAWIHTVLDAEERDAFFTAGVSDIDCIGPGLRITHSMTDICCQMHIERCQIC